MAYNPIDFAHWKGDHSNLEQLKEALDADRITDDECEARRQAILSKM
jgi:hypothetical protein